MKLLIVFVALFSFSDGFALEIDQKLTLRILKVSSSRKTILINRGIEDGIVQGDHAKFYLSVGVVARGVAIKMSPRRSVWSVYRLVNAPFIKEDQVMKLKITPAVKITKDESRMLVTDDPTPLSSDPRDLGIPLAEGADDLDLTGKSLINVSEKSMVSLLDRNKEIFGSFSYSSYTVETTSSNNSDSFSSDVTNIDLTAGMELYFKEESTWVSRISFLGLFRLSRRSSMSYQGSFVQNYATEFGGGVNLYPGVRPSKSESFIPYLGALLTLGTTNSKYTPGLEGGNGINEVEVDASVVNYEFSFGYKYFTRKGIGIRTEFAYQIRGDEFAKDEGGDTWVYTRSGPKIMTGLSYRF